MKMAKTTSEARADDDIEGKPTWYTIYMESSEMGKSSDGDDAVKRDNGDGDDDGSPTWYGVF